MSNPEFVKGFALQCTEWQIWPLHSACKTLHELAGILELPLEQLWSNQKPAGLPTLNLYSLHSSNIKPI